MGLKFGGMGEAWRAFGGASLPKSGAFGVKCVGLNFLTHRNSGSLASIAHSHADPLES
jgi:hypothetical protein